MGESQAKTPGRVLVVDMCYVNRKMSQAVLEARGHVVVAVEQPDDVLDLLARERFDLVLMDVDGVDGSGIRATRQIRGAMGLGHKDLPVLAVSAHSTIAEMKAVYESGMDDIVMKPVCPADLGASVDGWLSGHEMDIAPCCGHCSSTEVFNEDALGLAERLLGSDDARCLVREFLESFPHIIGDVQSMTSEAVLRNAFDRNAALAGNLGFMKISRLCRRLAEACSCSGAVDRGEMCRQLAWAFEETVDAYGQYSQRSGGQTGTE
ncbi:MAG: response regulator [Alphaproteobacteria bacterium]|nr:response regulator [Alphaproteobacteria bacterium]